MGKSASTPPAPDYTAAANATAAGNLKAAQTAAAANRVNQYTPYGSLTYQEAGTDSQGNPLWSATTSLSPDQQQLLNQQTQTSLGLGNLQSQGLDYVSNMLSKPFDTSQLAQTGINPGENYSDAIMRQLQPQIEADRTQLTQSLANQGIMPGSQAYNEAMRLQGNKEAQLRDQAITGGINVGLQANQQGFNQAGYIRNEPINTLNAIRSGSQVTNPTFTSVPQQSTTAGADLLGAAQGTYNAQLAAANAQNAANAGMTQGLFSLGGAALMAPTGTFSDVRMKENITPVGFLPNGLPVYEFEYKPEFKDIAGHGKHIGVMAQEVEQVIPEAVITASNGYKMVNYGALV